MAGKRDSGGGGQDPIVLKNGIAVLTPDPIAEGAFGRVHVGKILNPMGLLAERVVWGEEHPRWLGLDDIPYLENGRTGVPLPMIAPGQARRVYEAAERLWRDYLERRRQDRAKADEEFRDLLNLIDPMLHEDRVIAVKVLRPPAAEPRQDGPSEMERRFIKENDLLRALRHPGIVRRFGLVRDETMGWCLLMEYVEGETLDARLRAHEGGKMAFRAAAELVAQVADALAYVHEKGIAHRDLKPQNIMIRRDDGRAILMDFGIGKWVDETHTARLTMSGVRVGTPRYMAPEQALAEAPVGQAADVYQLSTILFELVTGRAAYAEMEVTQIFEWLMDPVRRHPADVRDLAPSISRDFETLIEVGRDKDPSKRWTIEEFRDRLRRLLEEGRFEGPGATDAPWSRAETVELLRLTRTRRKEIAWEERQLEDRLRLMDLQERLKDAWAMLERKAYLEARPAADALAREVAGLSARHASLKAEIENLGRAFERASARHEAESLLGLAAQHEGAGRYAETGQSLDAAKSKLDVLPAEAYADVHGRYRELSDRYETRHRSFVELLGTLRKSFVEKLQDRERELREAADAGRPPLPERVEDLAAQLAGAEKNLRAIERDKAGPAAYDGALRDLSALRAAVEQLRRRAASPA